MSRFAIVLQAILSARIPELGLTRARLGTEKSVAGIGVFATRDINAGELITCYPGDALVHSPTDGVIWGAHVPEALQEPGRCFASWIAEGGEDGSRGPGWVDYGLAEDDDYAVNGAT